MCVCMTFETILKQHFTFVRKISEQMQNPLSIPSLLPSFPSFLPSFRPSPTLFYRPDPARSSRLYIKGRKEGRTEGEQENRKEGRTKGRQENRKEDRKTGRKTERKFARVRRCVWKSGLVPPGRPAAHQGLLANFHV